MNSSLVSVISAGNMMKVTKNTNERPVKNYHAKKKLFFIRIKKATSSDRFFPSSTLLPFYSFGVFG